MENIERNGLIGWLSVGSFYPLLFEKVVPFLLGFPTTWLVEAGFSAVNDLLTKKRHQLQIKKRGDLRPVSTTSVEKSILCFIDFFCARFNFNRSLQSKINKCNKECSFPRS